MHRTSKLANTLAVLLLSAGVAPLAAAQSAAKSAAQPIVLFDGKSLDAWKPVEQPQMLLLPDGTLGNQRGKGLLYYATRPFSDFTLELEYLPETASASAGVFLRLPNAPASLDSAERNAYEVKLGEDPKLLPTFREQAHYTRSMFITGAINLACTRRVEHAARGRDRAALHRVGERREGERLLRPQGDGRIHRVGRAKSGLRRALPQRARHAAHRDEAREQRGRA